MQQTAEEVIRLGDPGDDLLLAKAFHRLGFLYFSNHLHARAVEAFERALVHSRRADERREEADILYLCAASTFVGPVPAQAAVPRWERVLEASRGRPALEAAANAGLALLYALQARFEEARQLLAWNDETYKGLGMTIHLAGNYYALAEVELLAGDPDAAQTAAREGYERFLALGGKTFASGGAAYLARATYAQGHFEEAERLSEVIKQLASSEDLQAQANWRAVRARVIARRGELEESLRLLDEVADLLEESEAPGLLADALMARAEVLRLANRTDEAIAAAERALDLYERKGNVPDAEKGRRLRHDLAAEALAQSGGSSA
jgi:tetratricopeptide (TPR) repeat protein